MRKIIPICICFFLAAGCATREPVRRHVEEVPLISNIEKLRAMGRTRSISIRKKEPGTSGGQPELITGLSLTALKKGEIDMGKSFLVTSDTILSSGDLLQVEFFLTQHSYIYVLLLDSSGKLHMLFPSSKERLTNPLEQGKKWRIPQENRMWYLDNIPGDETFFIVAARHSILDSLGKNMAMGMDMRGELCSTLDQARGIGVVVLSGNSGAERKDLKQVLSGQATFVRAVTFRHIR